ncbi:MAG: hypothetical protein L0338_36800 [Acidobacteria bacterium]|nr:hypothetical protein [Acidobacteriota bacterium]
MWLVDSFRAIFGRTPQRPASRRCVLIRQPEKYFVGDKVIQETYQHLKQEGMNDREGLVYWAGWYLDGVCVVTSALVPRGKSRYGGVQVPTDEMIRAANLLRKLDLLLVAQIHTHPGDHGHSPGDDVSAVSSLPGFLSIVVPNFARKASLDLEECYFHRYLGKGRWQELSGEESKKLIHIDPARIE